MTATGYLERLWSLQSSYNENQIGEGSQQATPIEASISTRCFSSIPYNSSLPRKS